MCLRLVVGRQDKNEARCKRLSVGFKLKNVLTHTNKLLTATSRPNDDGKTILGNSINELPLGFVQYGWSSHGGIGGSVCVWRLFQDGRDRGSKAHRPRLIDGHIASGGMHLGMYESSLCGPYSDRRDLAGTPLASRHSGGPSTPLLDFFCWPDDFRVLRRSCICMLCMHA